MFAIAKLFAPTTIFVASSATAFFVLNYSEELQTPNLYIVVRLQTLPTTQNPLNKTVENQVNAQYTCKLSNTVVIDEFCSLFKLNNLNDNTDDSIQLTKDNFKSDQLVNDHASLKLKSFYILKINQDFYQNLKAQHPKSSKYPQIILKDKFNHKLHFGEFSHEFDLIKKPEEPITEPKVNTFLARVKAPLLTTEADLKKDLYCKLGRKHFVPCKFFRPYQDGKNRRNNITPKDLIKLEPVSSPDRKILQTGNYVIVQLLPEFGLSDPRLSLDFLKTKEIEVYRKEIAFSEAEGRLFSFVYDQSLFGDISKGPDLFGLFTQTPKWGYFLATKHQKPSSGATEPNPLNSSIENKNYRCKYTKSGITNNYDDSCVVTPIKVPPSNTNTLTFETLSTTPTPNTSTTLNLSTEDSVFYKIRVDLNKLHNLHLDPSSQTSEVKIEIVDPQPDKTPSYDESNSTSRGSSKPAVKTKAAKKTTYFTLKHRIDKSEITGFTKYALVKTVSTSILPSKDKTQPSTCKISDFEQAVECIPLLTTPNRTPEFNSLFFENIPTSKAHTFKPEYRYLIKFSRPIHSSALVSKQITLDYRDGGNNTQRVLLNVENLIGASIPEILPSKESAQKANSARSSSLSTSSPQPSTTTIASSPSTTVTPVEAQTPKIESRFYLFQPKMQITA